MNQRVKHVWRLIFPPDYWKMSDNDLGLLAKSYGIAHAVRDPETGQTAMDREHAIAGLVARDSTLRSVLSFWSLAINLALTLLNIYLRFKPSH